MNEGHHRGVPGPLTRPLCHFLSPCLAPPAKSTVSKGTADLNLVPKRTLLPNDTARSRSVGNQPRMTPSTFQLFRYFFFPYTLRYFGNGEIIHRLTQSHIHARRSIGSWNRLGVAAQVRFLGLGRSALAMPRN